MARKHAKVQVNRLRTSYIATRIHDQVTPNLAGPNTFIAYLLRLGTTGRAVAIPGGLEVSLPFSSEDATAWSFWEAEKDAATRPRRGLRPPADKSEAEALFAARIPLRHQAKLILPSSAWFETPRMEALIYPFGWVVLVTVDHVWQKPVPLRDAADELVIHETQPASVLLGSKLSETSVVGAAEIAAGELSKLLATGEPWSPAVHRLTTVIDGTVDPEPFGMPPKGGEILTAMHLLAGGAAPFPDPRNVLVPRWDGARAFVWDPGDYVYMLRSGTCAILPRAIALRPASRGESTSGRHRRLELLIACLSANAGLIYAMPNGSKVRGYWARKSAFWMGRIYGPDSPAADYWGLESRSYIDMSPAKAAVEELRGGPLFVAPGMEAPTRYP